MMRIMRIGVVGRTVDKFYSTFTDEKDCGKVITSHFYLLFGCSFPIWLGGEGRLSIFSGVLVLGFSDAIASIAGNKYGKTKWFGSKKSVEGTLGFVLSLVVLCIFGETWLFPGNGEIVTVKVFWICLISVVIGTMEAVTLQNDNLVLPLTFYALYNLIFQSFV
ncbi:hypothetical protein BB558_005709 [Smittium angustum]|nr:hypothetical protein BB558_005709 [Smittium angustum]